MTNYLVLYKSDVTASDQMSNATPEQSAAGMQEWMAWFEKAGPALVDGGAPLSGSDPTTTGYSVLQADSREALDQILEGHPLLKMGTLDIYEALPMQGM
jgi:hypothetical protein